MSCNDPSERDLAQLDDRDLNYEELRLAYRSLKATTNRLIDEAKETAAIERELDIRIASLRAELDQLREREQALAQENGHLWKQIQGGDVLLARARSRDEEARALIAAVHEEGIEFDFCVEPDWYERASTWLTKQLFDYPTELPTTPNE